MQEQEERQLPLSPSLQVQLPISVSVSIFHYTLALPGSVSNVRASFENDVVGLEWDAPVVNTITSYSVEILLEGQLVFTRMTSEESLSASRDDIQEEGDVVRTMNTQYTVTIVARNGRGESEAISANFTISGGETTL